MKVRPESDGDVISSQVRQSFCSGQFKQGQVCRTSMRGTGGDIADDETRLCEHFQCQAAYV